VTATRQGYRSTLDLSFLVLILVVCGGLSLLTDSGVSSRACDAPGSPDCFLSGSARVPVLTAESQGRPLDLPGDNNDIDDSDDDDDDDAGALSGDTVSLVAHHGPAHLLIETPFDRPSSLEWESCSLRGPPRRHPDEPTCSPDHHSPDQISRPPACMAAESHRHPPNSPHHSPDDVDDRDVDDRDDDDDDGNDDSAGALAAASINLTADHADGRGVIQANSGVHAPVECEAHSLRGPPRFSFASHFHCLRAPPQSIPTPNQTSRARKRIGKETRSQL